MKNILKGPEPQKLKTFRLAHPQKQWRNFVTQRLRKEQVQSELMADQGGICAYCEINLLEKDPTGDADFRVEHFHPKSDRSTAHNWGLDWQNLLGCCHGGSQSNVRDASNRFSSPDTSCDVPKGNKNLDSVILNPLQLPAFPALFMCDRATGKIWVNTANCTQSNVSSVKAQQTLDELCLHSPRLNRFRRILLNNLNQHVQQAVSNGQSIGQARTALAQAHLRKDAQQHWPAFFTSIRSYLGLEAEQQLRAIGYQG